MQTIIAYMTATTDNLRRKSPAPYPMVLSPTPYNLPLSYNTARLAYHYVSSKLSKVINFHVIWKPICHFLFVANSNRDVTDDDAWWTDDDEQTTTVP